MSLDSERNQLYTRLRWALFIPAGMMGALWITALTIITAAIFPSIPVFIYSFSFIVLCAFFAPSHKTKIALILSTVQTALVPVLSFVVPVLMRDPVNTLSKLGNLILSTIVLYVVFGLGSAGGWVALPLVRRIIDPGRT